MGSNNLNNKIKCSENIINLMDEHLRELLRDDYKNDSLNPKLWENTFIKNQIDRRNSANGKEFTIEDHIRGIVYAMLSNQRPWSVFEDQMDMGEGERKGRLVEIDKIFHDYNVGELLAEETPDKLKKRITEHHWGNRRIYRQMNALININIPILQKIELEHGSIDGYYQELIDQDPSFAELISKLSNPKSKYKMREMGKALIAEYLRNVGYDLSKPDTHVMRILSPQRLGFLSENASEQEAIGVVQCMAEQIGPDCSSAQVDFTLWSYCSDDYGEICTSTPKCDKCRLRKYCNYPN